MGRTVSGGPECARCGSDIADVHLTAFGFERDMVVIDGKFLLNAACIAQPDSVQIEAVCKECGHGRYIEQSQWEWA
jgi:hypothetical protein